MNISIAVQGSDLPVYKVELLWYV